MVTYIQDTVINYSDTTNGLPETTRAYVINTGTCENEARCWTLKDENDNSFVTPLRFNMKLQTLTYWRMHLNVRQKYVVSRRFIGLLNVFRKS